jgi:hypothetical protein
MGLFAPLSQRREILAAYNAEIRFLVG